jgi:hypothetical protein
VPLLNLPWPLKSLASSNRQQMCSLTAVLVMDWIKKLNQIDWKHIILLGTPFVFKLRTRPVHTSLAVPWFPRFLGCFTVPVYIYNNHARRSYSPIAFVVWSSLLSKPGRMMRSCPMHMRGRAAGVIPSPRRVSLSLHVSLCCTSMAPPSVNSCRSEVPCVFGVFSPSKFFLSFFGALRAWATHVMSSAELTGVAGFPSGETRMFWSDPISL